MNKIHTDMPGDVILIHPDQKRIVSNILNASLGEMKKIISKQKRLVVSIFGGSGSGKSGVAVLLSEQLQEIGIKNIVISGDNYPRLIPEKNDQKREHIYHVHGRQGLADYLCGPEEIEYEKINHIIADFKNVNEFLSLKRMGKTEDSIWYEDVNVKDCSVLILEWTHGNNENLKGVDYPIYLYSTPEQTRERRIARNRNENAGSSFIQMVLEIEQTKLLSQVKSAKVIVDSDGTIISYDEFQKKYQTSKFDIRPMLNVYPDSLGGTVRNLNNFLEQYGKDAFASVYMLPSIFHSDLDRGFSIIDYDLEEDFSEEEDLKKLKDLGIDLKLDFVMNHLSVNSPQFKDLLVKGDKSEYKDFFINWNEFWKGFGNVNEDGVIVPQQDYIEKMFFRKPGLPILMVEMPEGKKVPYWNTFYQRIDEKADGTKEYFGQMDLNIQSDKVWDYYKTVIKKLAGYGAKIIRLDAFAYAPKKVGEKNFLNEPGTWELLEKVSDISKQYHIQLLPEIHAGYQEKIYEKIGQKGYMTYDFFLPGLIIDAIENSTGEVIAKWGMELVNKKINTVNMLGCHDGIPVLDLKGLISDERIQNLIDVIVKRGGKVKNLHGQTNIYYQVNATYYSALGEDDKKMLIARAIQMFMPGKPQVWYLDLFAGSNDNEAVEKAGKDGHKEINRTNLTMDDVRVGMKKEIVTEQLRLISFRKNHPVFKENAIVNIDAIPNGLIMEWQNESHFAKLFVDFNIMEYKIQASDEAKIF